jgi:alpha-L-rhamnosidase
LKRAGAGAAGALLTAHGWAEAGAQAADTQRSSGTARGGRRTSIHDAGAVSDGTTLNTTKIQAVIDDLAKAGGGTVVVPSGTFLTGALFLKPGVHLHLVKGAVLKGSTNTADYPKRRTRVEGHFEEWLPALINADACDGLRIDGEGTLDGNGAPFWKAFWDARAANNKTANLDVPRPRMALLQNSRDVQVRGITFKDSGFWNLHMYRCQHVLVENVRFEVPDGQRCPSTDGTDIDSCQDITIRGCHYRVDDDCVCLKGSKGPFATADKDSPAVERIRVENCTFERGGGVLTLGSEATHVRDVVVDGCTVPGHINVIRLKLRPDTPQFYEDVHLRNITLTGDQAGSKAPIVNISKWTQYFDLKGQAPPKSIVRNITLSNIKGSYGTFGMVIGNPGQTEISDVRLENIDVQLQDPTFKVGTDVKNLQIKNVLVNGKPLEPIRV